MQAPVRFGGVYPGQQQGGYSGPGPNANVYNEGAPYGMQPFNRKLENAF